ncbi:hypothetical protein Dsin_026938 [Dipteronia sinensis]|uniref:TF-B3 domain-containing protein n=1 Tax=Dipteronia sinensis TaxID=43782 RepID=A0AAE0A061_9ROSI|nr:hypothetical protein Dsin_026938 [Dipteronia sinensis]
MASRRSKQPSHFFKVILNSTLEDKKLKIPEKFVRIFGDELSAAVVTLTVPNGQVFRVNLTKDGTRFWFHDGWHEFIQYHSIGAGYFLVFEYRKNSSFNVLIFDTTACEIKYRYNDDSDEKPKNEKQNSLHKDEMENEHSVLPLKSSKNKVFDHFPRSSSKVQPQPSQQNLAKPSFTAEFKRVNDKRCKMAEVEEKDYKSTHSSDKAKNEDELRVLLADMGICVNKQFGNISTEEKERAIAAARLFKPKNPSFLVILRSADIHNRRIYVSAEFGHRYFSRSKCIKVVDCDGRKWPVEISWSPLCFITRLGGFSKVLNEGDICVFELISEKKLKVSILKKACSKE